MVEPYHGFLYVKKKNNVVPNISVKSSEKKVSKQLLHQNQQIKPSGLPIIIPDFNMEKKQEQDIPFLKVKPED